MCGIFGYIGSENSAEICLKGLKKLEYRGYDSAGLVGILSGKFYCWKEVGKVQILEQSWAKTSLPLSLALAHTRWATHGKPCRENAHPHFDQNHQVAVVHNGIIENYQTLKAELQAQGVQFASDTDTEVIAQLIAHLYEGNIAQATHQAISKLQGFWGLAVIHKNHPDQIIAAAKGNPLAIAFNPLSREVFLSSDPNAFEASNLEIFFLYNNELALIQSHKIEFFDRIWQPVQKTPIKWGMQCFIKDKGPYEHFMLKEIFEQPYTIQQALFQRLNEEFATVEFENFHISLQDLQSVQRILILGCGTSWHAGCIAASLLENKARIPCQAEIASEFRYKNPMILDQTLAIAISQSGETLDTIAAVREVKQRGTKVIAICNVPYSTLTREADATIFLKAGPEISVCSTKAFTSQLIVLSLLTVLLGRQRHLHKEEAISFLAELSRIPSYIEEVLTEHQTIMSVAKKYSHYSRFFYIGRHYMFSTSLEAALKLKEISYLNATGYPAGELKHGPIALIDSTFPVISLCGNQQTHSKLLSNLMEIKARGGPILAFAFKGMEDLQDIADDIIYLPKCSDEVAPIVFSVATQLFAYYLAREHGTDIDQPRNLAKSVTVE